MNTAMMCIREPYASAIFSGAKRFEYRTRRPRFEDPTRVLVYAPGDPGQILGEVTIGAIHEGTPDSIWQRTRQESGLEHADFSAYFAGRTVSYALEILSAKSWAAPAPLERIRQVLGQGFRPPQSFIWLNDVDWTPLSR